MQLLVDIVLRRTFAHLVRIPAIAATRTQRRHAAAATPAPAAIPKLQQATGRTRISNAVPRASLDVAVPAPAASMQPQASGLDLTAAVVLTLASPIPAQIP